MFRFKQNIGIVNSLIRITVGMTIFGMSTVKLARKPWCFSAKLMMFLGAMKVAEGIVRFCPIVEAMKFGKYMNLPVMNMMKTGNDNKQAAKPASSEKQSSGSHESGYDASDKQLETEIATVLGTKSL